MCVLAWLAWRVTRARRKGRDAKDNSPWTQLFPGGGPSKRGKARIGRALGRIPLVKRQPWVLRWQALGDEDAVPITREKSVGDRSSWLDSYYAPPNSEKRATESTPRVASVQHVVMPPLNTNFDFDFAASQHASPENVSPQSGTSAPSTAVLASHPQGGDSFNSLDNQGGTWVYVSSGGTGAAPQAQRNYRASELSSLSSGFGDGELVPPPRAARDTMYTATSEDQPARFRTLSSWVDQQTGRIHRAQQRVRDGDTVVSGEGVPPVPGIPAGAGENGLPPEPVFNMMMPDGEVPRRADDGTR